MLSSIKNKYYSFIEKFKGDNEKIIVIDKKENYFINLFNHINLHIFLLAIFESLLFFYFVLQIEYDVFISKVSNYVDDLTNYFIDNNNILFTIIDTSYLNNFLYELQDKSEFAEELREENNLILYNKSIIITSCLGIFFIIVLFISSFKYNISIKKLFFEHIVLLSFIAIFEICFFLFIALKYETLSSDELNYIFVSCFLKNLDEQGIISVNHNITHDCSL